MKALYLTPKKPGDFELLKNLCERLDIPMSIVLNEEVEDGLLLNAMLEAGDELLSEQETQEFLASLDKE